MSRLSRCLALILAAMFAATSPAQVTTATLYGVVVDSTGAVAPNAAITATHQSTGISRDVASDPRGEFTIPVLPAGRYTLKITLAGFKTYVNDGLNLNAGQVARQTFALEVGQLSENVTVSESAPLVETASAAQKESLGTQEVRSLPLARRNVTSLLTSRLPLHLQPRLRRTRRLTRL